LKNGAGVAVLPRAVAIFFALLRSWQRRHPGFHVAGERDTEVSRAGWPATLHKGTHATFAGAFFERS
jgi:hypothetical protein